MTDVLEALSLVWLNDKKILSVVIVWFSGPSNLCTPSPLYGLSYARTQVAANSNSLHTCRKPSRADAVWYDRNMCSGVRPPFIDT